MCHHHQWFNAFPMKGDILRGYVRETRTKKITCCSHLVLRLYSFQGAGPVISFVNIKVPSKQPNYIRGHVFLSLFQSGTFHFLCPMTFEPLLLVRLIGDSFCQIFFSWDLTAAPPMIRFRLGILEAMPHILWNFTHESFIPLLIMFILTSIKKVPTKHLHCKVALFLFTIMNMCFEGRFPTGCVNIIVKLLVCLLCIYFIHIKMDYGFLCY